MVKNYRTRPGTEPIPHLKTKIHPAVLFDKFTDGSSENFSCRFLSLFGANKRVQDLELPTTESKLKGAIQGRDLK